jgi:hypothetical protein
MTRFAAVREAVHGGERCSHRRCLALAITSEINEQREAQREEQRVRG